MFIIKSIKFVFSDNILSDCSFDIYSMTIKDLISKKYRVFITNEYNQEVISIKEKDDKSDVHLNYNINPNGTIEDLRKEIEELKEKEMKYIAHINTLETKIKEKDAKLKCQIDELESRQSSFNYLMNAKKAEIEKLRQDKNSELHNTIKTLEKEVSDLKLQLNEKEIKILDFNDRILELENKNKLILLNTIEQYEKEIQDMNDQLSRIKTRYFFSLAISCKLDSFKNKSVDLNFLYNQCKLENVPIENWHSWISQYVNENKREEGEEENVENF